MTNTHYIVYDGQCKFCTAAAQFALAHAASTTLAVIAVQATEARELLRTRGIQFINLNTIYFITPSAVLVKSTAVFAICTQLKAPYKWLSSCAVLPTWLTDGVYNFIAKNRYRFN